MATTTAPPFQSTSLYVGDLAHDISEGHLFELFNMVGPVASIRVCRDAVTRRSLGYAYVNFHNPNDAERALDTLNNTQVKNGRSERPCRIMWSQRDPSVRKSGVGNIFIKNLDKTIDHKALYDTFSDFGNILSCKVAMDEHNQSKGYGFVHYETQEMADRAIEKVNGMSIADKEVFVGPFVPKKERLKHNANNFTNVFVKNIDPSVKDEDIHNLFSKFGQITSWVVTRDSDKERVFGFLNFENHEASALAVEKVNGTELKGKILYVGRAQKKAERQAELRSKWEQMKSERAAKYQGVNLYIKNLDDDFDDEKLRKAFTPYGTITSAKVMTDDKGNSKGFGFVCFSTPEEANKCVPEMNGRVVGSKPLYVALAQRREERRAQLEAQHNAQRAKGRPFPGGNMQGAVYSSGAPLFYQGNMPPQQFVYQQQLVHRNRWAGPPPQAGPYQPMPPNYIMPPVARQPRNNVRQVPGGRRFNNQARNAREQPGVPVAIAQGGPAQIPGGDGVMPSAEPLTVDLLAQYSPEQQFLIASQRLYPMIHKAQPTLAPKITGMIRAAYLEHNQGPEELIRLLESPEALNNRIGAALEVWEAHVQESGKTDDSDTDASHIPTVLVGDVSVAH